VKAEEFSIQRRIPPASNAKAPGTFPSPHSFPLRHDSVQENIQIPEMFLSFLERNSTETHLQRDTIIKTYTIHMQKEDYQNIKIIKSTSKQSRKEARQHTRLKHEAYSFANVKN
jgi:hypothetical protein